MVLHAFTMLASARGLCLARRLYSSLLKRKVPKYKIVTLYILLQEIMSSAALSNEKKTLTASFVGAFQVDDLLKGSWTEFLGKQLLYEICAHFLLTEYNDKIL